MTAIRRIAKYAELHDDSTSLMSMATPVRQNLQDECYAHTREVMRVLPCGDVDDADVRPVSDTARVLAERQSRWKRKAGAVLLRSHVDRQLRGGFGGIATLAAFVYLPLRIIMGALRQALKETVRGTTQQVLRLWRRGGGDGSEGEGTPTKAVA